MRFSPTRFDRHLDNLSQRFLWRRAYGCSCVNPNSGAPDSKCKLCLGKGHLWDEPIVAKAAAAGQSTQMQWAGSGLYDVGDIVLSVPQNSAIWDSGAFDRITFLNATDRFSMPLTRGAPSERLFFQVASVERCFWKHPQTGALVEGGLPAISADGMTFTWLDREPPAGTTYSLTGTRFIEYFIFKELPRNRNMHGGVRLPKNIAIRRFDLLSR